MRIYDSLDFLNNKKICMQKFIGEQGLALQQHFPYKSSKFSENSSCRIKLLFNARKPQFAQTPFFVILSLQSKKRTKFSNVIGY